MALPENRLTRFGNAATTSLDALMAVDGQWRLRPRSGRRKKEIHAGVTLECARADRRRLMNSSPSNVGIMTSVITRSGCLAYGADFRQTDGTAQHPKRPHADPGTEGESVAERMVETSRRECLSRSRSRPLDEKTPAGWPRSPRVRSLLSAFR